MTSGFAEQMNAECLVEVSAFFVHGAVQHLEGAAHDLQVLGESIEIDRFDRDL
ncbi:hypothetical protein [Promicromonospora sp. NPDC059942]|uniref:hypothetical protein n=1 Tax=Promicromonospora sp. NPDC059942 TaxID=3347009 RepID=UPI00365A8B96